MDNDYDMNFDEQVSKMKKLLEQNCINDDIIEEIIKQKFGEMKDDIKNDDNLNTNKSVKLKIERNNNDNNEDIDLEHNKNKILTDNNPNINGTNNNISNHHDTTKHQMYVLILYIIIL